MIFLLPPLVFSQEEETVDTGPGEELIDENSQSENDPLHFVVGSDPLMLMFGARNVEARVLINQNVSLGAFYMASKSLYKEVEFNYRAYAYFANYDFNPQQGGFFARVGNVDIEIETANEKAALAGPAIGGGWMWRLEKRLLLIWGYDYIAAESVTVAQRTFAPRYFSRLGYLRLLVGF